MPSWNVLVVDDEEDVHNITRIALRRRTWRDRRFSLTHARSGKEARELLEAADAPMYHCALVDAVMETDDAGLRLCDFIRSNLPRTTRIILRTGQAGAAPPEKVINEYDIDYYLSKTEVTDERLFMTLRACIRSSLDIAAILAVGAQLRAFTVALQDPSTTQATLMKIMTDSLRLLEDKYDAQLAFMLEGDAPAESSFGPGAAKAIAAGHRQKLAPMELHAGTLVGLEEGTFVVLTTVLDPAESSGQGLGDKVKQWFKNLLSEEAKAGGAGLAVKFQRELTPNARREFLQDFELFVTNWRVVESARRIQDRLLRDRIEMLRNYGQP